jgi:hypothetical protein
VAAFGQKPKQVLTNEEITKMVKGGFTEEVIVALIESSDSDFDVSIEGLSALKEAGVSGKVMEAMLTEVRHGDIHFRDFWFLQIWKWLHLHRAFDEKSM